MLVHTVVLLAVFFGLPGCVSARYLHDEGTFPSPDYKHVHTAGGFVWAASDSTVWRLTINPSRTLFGTNAFTVTKVLALANIVDFHVVEHGTAVVVVALASDGNMVAIKVSATGSMEFWGNTQVSSSSCTAVRAKKLTSDIFAIVICAAKMHIVRSRASGLKDLKTIPDTGVLVDIAFVSNVVTIFLAKADEVVCYKTTESKLAQGKFTSTYTVANSANREPVSMTVVDNTAWLVLIHDSYTSDALYLQISATATYLQIIPLLNKRVVAAVRDHAYPNDLYYTETSRPRIRAMTDSVSLQWEQTGKQLQGALAVWTDDTEGEDFLVFLTKDDIVLMKLSLVPPTDVPPTPAPPTPAPPTDVPPTPAPDTDTPPTAVPTAIPDTLAPPTDAPPTDVPDTLAPPTDAPPTVAPDTDAPPTDAPPTVAPDTDAPPTAVPDTLAPPTAAPPTDAPPTSVPETEVPPTSVPDTSAPPTDAPETLSPPTGVPPTPAPPTDVPDTPAPPTAVPPTDVPETLAPPTVAPDTDAPPTDAPPTVAPDTDAPQTAVPDTLAPPTAAPPTDAPTTSVPETEVPTSVPETLSPPTVAPDTGAPNYTDLPDTLAPATAAPPTDAPATPAPQTDVPETLAPTSAPDTLAPPTAAPPTVAPDTDAPPTDAPPTVAPDTDAPPTAVPDTLAPPTAAPPTNAPPTSVPETEVPPTGVPETTVPQTDTPSTDVPPADAPATDTPDTTAPTPLPTTSAPVVPTDAPAVDVAAASAAPANETQVEVVAPVVDEGVEKTIDAGGVVVGAVSFASGSAAGLLTTRLVMVTVGCHLDGEVVELPVSLHPTQLKIMGSSSAGVVAGNTAIAVGVSLVSSVFLSVFQRFAARYPGIVTEKDRQGLLRLPAIPYLVFQLLYQGTAFGAMNLVMQPPNTYLMLMGVAAVLACVALPCLLFASVGRNVPRHAAYMVDDRPTALWVRFLCGNGQWVSLRSELHWVRRFGTAVRLYRQELVWFSIIEFAASFALSCMMAINAASLEACGHVKFCSALVFLSLVMLEARLRPHARTRDTFVDVFCLTMEMCACGLMAAGYYDGHRIDDGWQMNWAALLLVAAAGLLIARAVVDVVAILYLKCSGRQDYLQMVAFHKISRREAPNAERDLAAFTEKYTPHALAMPAMTMDDAVVGYAVLEGESERPRLTKQLLSGRRASESAGNWTSEYAESSYATLSSPGSPSPRRLQRNASYRSTGSGSRRRSMPFPGIVPTASPNASFGRTGSALPSPRLSSSQFPYSPKAGPASHRLTPSSRRGTPAMSGLSLS